MEALEVEAVLAKMKGRPDVQAGYAARRPHELRGRGETLALRVLLWLTKSVRDVRVHNKGDGKPMPGI